jgi:PPOX class probable F420-dependent enzyme
MREMTRAEAVEFLMTGTRTGKLATVRSDGRPHVVPIWFMVEDDALVFTTWYESVKCHNMRREMQAALVVDLEQPPYAYVVVEGGITMSDDADELLRIATEVGGRYMGADRAVEFGKRNAVEGELVVRLSMDKIIARADISD